MSLRNPRNKWITWIEPYHFVGEKVILSGQESKEEDGDKEKEDEKMDAEDDDGDLLPPMPFSKSIQ